MTTPTPAGWYDDPEDSNSQRYWDGQSWTPHRQRKQISQPAPQPAGPAATPPPPPAAPGQQAQWLPPAQPPGGVPSRRSRTALLVVAALAVVGVVVVVGVLVFMFVLSDKTVVPDKAAKMLTNAVSAQNGFTPTDAKCPSGVKAKVGQTFDCHFTGPDGSTVTSHMKVTKVDGDYLELDMKWGQD